MSITTYRRPNSFDYKSDDCDKYEEIRAHAVNHVRSCPRGRSGWPDTSRTKLTNDCVRHGCSVGYICVSYVGRVISTRERNGYHDSDFYATVWTDDGPAEIEYASTRGWTYFNGATVDATPEVLEAYAEWKGRRRKASEIAATQREAKLEILREALPSFGQRWRVKSKRSKLPHGAVVEIAGDPIVSQYAAPLNGGRYSERPKAVSLGIMPSETLEERYHERPGDIAVKVRCESGRQAWVSASVLELDHVAG